MREIIDDIYAKGECEFVAEVGKRFPITIFLKMAGAPIEDRLELQEFIEKILRSPDMTVREEAAAEILAYHRRLIDERKNEPRDDLISQIVQANMLGRPLTQGEMESAVYQIFLAGLDTVAAALSFTIRFLARNQDHYAQLVDDPSLIDGSIEELFRISGVAMPERGVKIDHDYEGVSFRRGEQVVVLSTTSGLDPRQVDDPERVDFHREVSRHFIFGMGPHRCLGSHLARLEMKVFLEEWVKRFPAFRMADNKPVKIYGGIVWIPAALPLEWDVRSDWADRRAA